MKFFSPAAAAIVGIAIFAPLASSLQPSLETGPPFPLSTPAPFGSAPGGQAAKALVPTPAGWIAVWDDETAQPCGPDIHRLLATRIAVDGSVLDTTGIRIASDVPEPWSYTALPEYGGARLYWTSEASGRTILYSAFVSDEGQVSEITDIGECPGCHSTAPLSAASSGPRTSLLLDGRIALLERGQVLRVVDLGVQGTGWSIEAASSRFIVSWRSDFVLRRQTLDIDGNLLLPAEGIAVASQVTSHDLASDGTDVLFVWSEGPLDEASLLKTAILDAASGEFVERGKIEELAPDLRALWTGSEYLVTWRGFEPGGLRAIDVTPDGRVVDEPPRTIVGDPGAYLLSESSGSRLLLSGRGMCLRTLCEAGFEYVCESDLFVSALRDDGEPQSQLLSAAATPQAAPLLASNGTSYLSVWREDLAGAIAAELVDRDHAPSARFGITAGGEVATALASDGDGYLASWLRYRNGENVIEGVRLEGENGVLTRHFVSSRAGNEASTLATGAAPGMYLLVWNTDIFDPTLVAMRTQSDGEPIDAVPITLSRGRYLWTYPSVAFDGDDFVVAAWLAKSVQAKAPFDLVTFRVTRGGTAKFDRAWSSQSVVNRTALDCERGVCLLVWAVQVPGADSSWQLVGQRFREGGELIDMAPFDIDLSSRRQIDANVSWNGNRFVVTWSIEPSGEARGRIKAKTFTSSGPITDSPPELLGDYDIRLDRPAISCNHHGRCMIVQPEWIDDPLLGRTTRLFKRYFGEARRRAARR